MIGKIVHAGLVVSDLERSMAFYRDVLGLELVSRSFMEGPSTDALFAGENMRCELAYFNGGGEGDALVELLCFTKNPARKVRADLHTTSIAELCFAVDDLEAEYRRLKALGVDFVSEPQSFELAGAVSKAVYLRDPDGNILELYEA